MDYMLPNNAEVSVQFICYSPTARQQAIGSLKYSQILPSTWKSITVEMIEGKVIKSNDKLKIQQDGIY